MMRYLSIHTAAVLLCAIAGLLLSSCIYDRYDESDYDPERDGVQFVFRIGAVGADANLQSARVVETVNSLRIIIIDENGRLDINERIGMSASSAKSFGYTFIRNLKPGAKRIFLIANEESVGAVLFRTVPDGVPTENLTAMLDHFAADSAEASPTDFTGRRFAELLNDVYFKNSYSIVDDKIALPYSAYYKLDEAELYGEGNPLSKIEKQMYLVPVAAKFDFVFTNYRRHDAYIDDVIISSVNSHNYLNARLDGSELRRTTPDGKQDVWWIDWLEECARGSQTANDIDPDADTDKTGGYNGRWGWISNYLMPVTDEEMVELSLNPNNEEWKLDKLIYISDPSRKYLGPFYVPESLNVAVPAAGGGSGASQSYSLTFKVHDDRKTAAPAEPDDDADAGSNVTVLSGYEIDTLKALFRATHIIIYVEFYESEAEIYAEIAPWEKQLFLGFVQQDEEY